MRYATITVQTEQQAQTALLEAGRRIDAGEGYQGEHFSFRSLDLLFEVYTPKRWQLIRELQKLGPSSLRGLARALGRDVKRVHEDAAVLLDEGIIERNVAGKLVVPFDHIHFEADLRSEAA